MTLPPLLLAPCLDKVVLLTRRKRMRPNEAQFTNKKLAKTTTTRVVTVVATVVRVAPGAKTKNDTNGSEKGMLIEHISATELKDH